MNQPGLQQIRDDLAFMDDVAIAIVAALMTHHDSDTFVAAESERRRRLAIGAYNMAADLCTERRLRHQNALTMSTARRTA